MVFEFNLFLSYGWKQKGNELITNASKRYEKYSGYESELVLE